MASFLRPQGTTKSTWNFGNNSTCTAVGFFNQVSFSNTFFVCMLSCYFLLATRFGYTNEQVSKRVEPFMHVTAIGYPLVTSIISLSQGWYGEVENGLSCWIRMRFGANCAGSDEEGQAGNICISEVVIWMFYVLPTFIAFACLVINGAVMFEFVLRHKKKTRAAAGTSLRHSTFIQDESSTQSDVDEEHDEEYGEGEESTVIEKYEDVATARIEKHNARLKMLASQAFLYVLSFFICNLATTSLVLLESKSSSETARTELIATFFPLAVMQAIFHPLQGLLNMLIFARPKYMNYRNKYTSESRSSVVRMALFGFDSSAYEEAGTAVAERSKSAKQVNQRSNVKDAAVGKRHPPEMNSSGQKAIGPNEHSEQTRPSTVPLRREMLSSLTGSIEEYEVPLKFGKEQTGLSRSSATKKQTRSTGESIIRTSLRVSELEMISELSESVFESIVDVDCGDSLIRQPSRDLSSEFRWGSTQSRRSSDVSPRLALKIPLDSSARTCEDEFDLSERRWGSSVGKSPSDMSLTPSKQSILRRISSPNPSDGAPNPTEPANEDRINISINPIRQLFRVSSDDSSSCESVDIPEPPPPRKQSPPPRLMSFQGLQK